MPGSITLIIERDPRTQDTGYIPPDMALPRVMRSGVMLAHWEQSMRPVRPIPVWISSIIRRTLCFLP